MTGRWSTGAALLLLWFSAPAAGAPFPQVNPQFAAPGTGTTVGATVTSAALIENASAWDGCVISYAGEAVGEALTRADHAWLQVNDDAYQVRNPGAGRLRAGYNSGQAIWVPLALARRVRFFGDYHTEGDAVRLSGEFHAACREHGGDMDIHATGLEVVREGRAVTHRLNRIRLWLGLGLFAFAGVLWWQHFRGTHTGRRGGAEGMVSAPDMPAGKHALRAGASMGAPPPLARLTPLSPPYDVFPNRRTGAATGGGPQRQDPVARTGTR
jgi:hypothetical protein